MATLGMTSTLLVRMNEEDLLGCAKVAESTVELLLGVVGEKAGPKARSNFGECACPISGVDMADPVESSRMGGGIALMYEPLDVDLLRVISSRLILRFDSVVPSFPPGALRRWTPGLADSVNELAWTLPWYWLWGLGVRRNVGKPLCLWPWEWFRMCLRVNLVAPVTSFSARHRVLVVALKYLVNHTHSDSGIINRR